MKDLYRPLFLNETPFVLTNIPTAELAKYAGNAFLATKISFINEMALICEKVGGDVQAIARAMGLDRRIGKKFLHAGPGFGGSCFPKDTHSVAHFAAELGVEFKIANAVIEVNARQRLAMIDKVVTALGGEVEGAKVGVLGLSFKPETDDMRDAPSVDVVNALLERGAEVRAFDPQAMKEAQHLLPSVHLCKDAYEACEGADVLVIVTEWNEFRALDLERVKAMMRTPRLVDMRNIYEPKSMKEAGIEYWSVGR
jgi:UDPglucose 6-dehydrogenase